MFALVLSTYAELVDGFRIVDMGLCLEEVSGDSSYAVDMGIHRSPKS